MAIVLSQNVRIVFFCSVFFLSGVAGLAYESIWTHYIKLFVGHASYAQSLVIATFMGGMALGSWLCSLVITRITNPLIGYILIEVAIACYAFAFDNLSSWSLKASLDNQGLLTSIIGVKASLWSSSVALLLPGAILLGATFPMFAAAILGSTNSKSGYIIAILYGANSLGAAIGVLVNGLWTIPNLGLPGALLLAASINVFISFTLYLYSKLPNITPIKTTSSESIQSTNESEFRNTDKYLFLVAAGTGFASFIYEIIWLRGLSLAFGAATISFELMLSAFILGLAIGGFWVRKRLERSTVTLIYFLAKVQIIMGSFAIVTTFAFYYSFDLITEIGTALNRNENGYNLYLTFIYSLAILAMLPTTICAGMTLPTITEILYKSNGQSFIGKVYATNTVGSILGIIFALNILLPAAGIKNGILFGAIIDISLGLILLLFIKTKIKTKKELILITSPLLLLASTFTLSSYGYKVHSSVFRKFSLLNPNNVEVLYYKDGKTASVSVLKYKSSDIISLATNGKVDASAPKDQSDLTSDSGDMPTQIFLGALPLAYHSNPERVAIIGFGSGITTHTILSSELPKQVFTIEIEPAVIEGAKEFNTWNHLAYEDPRNNIIIEDAKAFFATQSKPLDVVISEPSNPWVSGVASLFTKEFYEKLKYKISDDGILVQWIHTYEFNDILLASITNAILEHFSHVEVHTFNRDLILVASKQKKSPDYSKIISNPKIGSIIQALGYKSINDIASTKSLDESDLSMLQTLFPTQNSDYFPIVDSNGPTARFLGQTAQFPTNHLQAYTYKNYYENWFQKKDESIQTQSLNTAMIFGARSYSNAWLQPSADQNNELFVMTKDKASRCETKKIDQEELISILTFTTNASRFLNSNEVSKLVNRIKNSNCFADFERAKQYLTALEYARNHKTQELTDLIQQENITSIENPLDELFVVLGIQRTQLRTFDKAVSEWKPLMLSNEQVMIHKLTYNHNDPFNMTLRMLSTAQAESLK